MTANQVNFTNDEKFIESSDSFISPTLDRHPLTVYILPQVFVGFLLGSSKSPTYDPTSPSLRKIGSCLDAKSDESSSSRTTHELTIALTKSTISLLANKMAQNKGQNSKLRVQEGYNNYAISPRLTFPFAIIDN